MQAARRYLLTTTRADTFKLYLMVVRIQETYSIDEKGLIYRLVRTMASKEALRFASA